MGRVKDRYALYINGWECPYRYSSILQAIRDAKDIFADGMTTRVCVRDIHAGGKIVVEYTTGVDNHG